MRVSRTGGWVAGIAAIALLVGATGAPPVSQAALADDAIAVVVQGASLQDAADAVARHGGTIDRELELVDGVSARLSPAALTSLEQDATVTVTPDVPLRFSSADLQLQADTTGGDQLQAVNPGETWSPEAGSGVGVALIDTGVTVTPELAGRVIHAVDYSDEGDHVDHYGHGTFMAGLIAGNGDASTGEYYGVAPGAHIVSLKLAGRDGVTSLAKVLDAIGWVVVNQDEYGIRVLNLSLGMPTKLAPEADPLSAAVEAAWASGITVVAASGNDGAGVVTSPGRDPYVITVGSSDINGTADVSDDTVPSWSGSGKVTSNEKPELLAPGASVVSLRAPGSYVDEQNPQARIGDTHFRGSGTSMSTAVVSGAVAALAELRPLATPDDLKGALVTTGVTVADSKALAIDLAAADAAVADGAWRQGHKVVFKGLDGHAKRGMPWTQAGSPAPEETWARLAWSDDAWHRLAWSDGVWHRLAWSDGAWHRLAWSRLAWSDTDFARLAWSDANLARLAWSDTNFTRLAWSRLSWSRMSWSRLSWSGDNWDDETTTLDWSAATWSGQS